jgi:putative endonuclease
MGLKHIAWVYIMTNEANTTLYIGSTTDIFTRMWEHRTKQHAGSFTARYNIYKLVYFRGFQTLFSARQMERYMKGKSRQWKIRLIDAFNPLWIDLTKDVKDE